MNKRKLMYVQTGLSLIELMISMGIGIILLLALASVYVTASNTSRARSADDALDEAARQVFDRLQADLDFAGYVDIFDTTAVSGSGASGAATETVAASVAKPSLKEVQDMYGRLMPTPTSGLSIAPAKPSMPIEIASGGTYKALEGEDAKLTIAYQAAPANPNAHTSLPSFSVSDNADSGITYDCTGAKLDSGDKWIVNIYSFDKGSFNCKGNKSSSSQPIVDNIKEMTFRYLVTQPATDSKATLYDSPAGLYTTNIISAADVNTSALGWSGVTGVEVCMIVAGKPLNGRLSAVASLQEKIPTCERNGNSYVDNKSRPANDQSLYRRYVKVLGLPNALYFRQ